MRLRHSSNSQHPVPPRQSCLALRLVCAVATWGWVACATEEEVPAAPLASDSGPVQDMEDLGCRSLDFGRKTEARGGLGFEIGTNPDARATVEAWVWLDEYVEGEAQALMSTAMKTSSGQTDFAFLVPRADHRLGWVTGSSDDPCAWLRGPQLSTGAWHHVAGTLAATGAQTGSKALFIDGELVEECTYTSKALPNDGRLTLGAHREEDGSLTGRLHGKLDEVRISSSVRYKADFEPSTYLEVDENTVALWHLDEGAGLRARDAAGDNDLILKAPSWSEDSVCDLE